MVTKVKRVEMGMSLDQCFDKVITATEKKHECLMDAARYMCIAYTIFTEVDGNNECHFRTLASKATGLSRNYCWELVIIHQKFSGLSCQHGRLIEDGAYRYAVKHCSDTVIRKMHLTARRGRAVSYTEVRVWHFKDRGLTMGKPTYNIRFSDKSGKWSHNVTCSAKEDLTVAQLRRRLTHAVQNDTVIVTKNQRGRRAA